MDTEVLYVYKVRFKCELIFFCSLNLREAVGICFANASAET